MAVTPQGTGPTHRLHWTLALALLVAAFGWAIGCGGGDGADDHTDHADEGDGAGEHADEGDGGGGDVHGEGTELGEIEVAGLTADVDLFSEIVAGGEAVVVATLSSADGVVTVRGWIGGEDGTQHRKVSGHRVGTSGAYDLHIIVGDPLPDGAQVWIEVELDDGRMEAAAVDLP